MNYKDSIYFILYSLLWMLIYLIIKICLKFIYWICYYYNFWNILKHIFIYIYNLSYKNEKKKKEKGKGNFETNKLKNQNQSHAQAFGLCVGSSPSRTPRAFLFPSLTHVLTPTFSLSLYDKWALLVGFSHSQKLDRTHGAACFPSRIACAQRCRHRRLGLPPSG
jgi:hypothetical protein